MRYGQANIPRDVSGRGPQDVCLTVSRNHTVFLLHGLSTIKGNTIFEQEPFGKSCETHDMDIGLFQDPF